MNKKIDCIYCGFQLEEVNCIDNFYDNITIKNIPTLICSNKNCNEKYYSAKVHDKISSILDGCKNNDIVDYNNFE